MNSNEIKLRNDIRYIEWVMSEYNGTIGHCYSARPDVVSKPVADEIKKINLADISQRKELFQKLFDKYEKQLYDLKGFYIID